MGPNYIRIITAIFLFSGIFIFPLWFLGCLFVFCFIKFSNFYEGLLIAFLYDIFYSVQRDIFWGLPIFFIVMILVFVIDKLIRKQFRV